MTAGTTTLKHFNHEHGKTHELRLIHIKTQF